MSEHTTPIGIVFDLQRTAIEGTHEAVTRTIEAQQAFGQALVDFGSAKQMNEHGYETVRSFVDAYFGVVESAMSAQTELLDDARAAVDEQLDTLEATQVDAIEAFEGSVDNEADELVEEFVAALDRGFEAALDAHEDVEAQTVEAFEGVEGNLEELQAEYEEQVAEIQP